MSARRPRRRASPSFSDTTATSEPALAIWWRRLDVGLGDRQVGGRLVQVSVEQVIGGAHQGQLGVIRGSLGKARTSAWIVCACPSRVRLNE